MGANDIIGPNSAQEAAAEESVSVTVYNGTNQTFSAPPSISDRPDLFTIAPGREMKVTGTDKEIDAYISRLRRHGAVPFKEDGSRTGIIFHQESMIHSVGKPR